MAGQRKLVAKGSIAAGSNKLDYTSDNAFVEFGVDISAYQTGRHAIKITDAAGKVAKGYISATAPGGETFGDELIGNVDFASDLGWWEKGGGTTIDDGVAHINYFGATTAVLKKTNAFIEGSVVFYSVDCVAHTSGGCPLFIGSSSTGYMLDGIKTISDYRVIDSNPRIQFTASSAVLDIDNVTCKNLTDCAATGALIVSTLGGSTRSWTSVDTGFNPNLACTWKIFRV